MGRTTCWGRKRPDCHAQPLGTEAGLQLLEFARTSSGEARGRGTRKSAEACDHPGQGAGRAAVGPEKGQLAGGQAASQTGGACLQRSGWAKSLLRGGRARSWPWGAGCSLSRGQDRLRRRRELGQAGRGLLRMWKRPLARAMLHACAPRAPSSTAGREAVPHRWRPSITWLHPPSQP